MKQSVHGLGKTLQLHPNHAYLSLMTLGMKKYRRSELTLKVS